MAATTTTLAENTLVQAPESLSPIVSDLPERKKKKKKYSRDLRDIQRLDRGLAKASRRINGAIADGLSTYLKASDKSARKRRDGAIQDAMENWAKATEKTLRRASRAPVIIAEALNTKSSRRQFRAFVRLATSPFAR